MAPWRLRAARSSPLVAGVLPCAWQALELQYGVPERGHLRGLHSDAGDCFQKRAPPHDGNKPAHVVEVAVVDDPRHHPARVRVQIGGRERSIPEQPRGRAAEQDPCNPSRAVRASSCHYTTAGATTLTARDARDAVARVGEAPTLAANRNGNRTRLRRQHRDRRVGAQLPSDASGRGQRARRPQRRLLPGRRLSPALHRAPPLEGRDGAAARRQAVVLLHPRDQPRHAALDLADHQAAAQLYRSRHLQRHRLHHQGGQAGGDVPRPVRSGPYLHHRGRGQPAQPLEQALPGAAHRRAGGQAGGPGRRPRSVPGRRHLLRLLRRRRSGVDQVHRPGQLALRRSAPAAQPARCRPGRRHLLRQPVSARRQVDAAVHQPPDRLPLLPRRLGCTGGAVRAAGPRAHELAARRPVAHRPGVPRLLRPGERAHRRRAARDVGLAVHRRPGDRPEGRCSRCRAS